MFKQVVFFRKRLDMTPVEFMDYYENQHSKLPKSKGFQSSIPGAVRYVRRYLTPLKNAVTGEILDPGYDCLMEIWWNSREDYEKAEAARDLLSDPERLKLIKEDEMKLFATHSNPICFVEEHDSPMGPNGEIPRVELSYSSQPADGKQSP